MDFANQLPERPAGHAPQHVEDGELESGQRQSEGDSVVAEVELIDKDLLHD